MSTTITAPQGNRQQRRAVHYESGSRTGMTSRKSADKDVARGIANWDAKGLLVYVVTDHRVISAERTACHPRRFQNGDGFATLEAIAGLPCVQPRKLLTGKRPASPPRDYPTVEISRQAIIVPQPVPVSWPAPDPLGVLMVSADGQRAYRPTV